MPRISEIDREDVLAALRAIRNPFVGKPESTQAARIVMFALQQRSLDSEIEREVVSTLKKTPDFKSKRLPRLVLRKVLGI